MLHVSALSLSMIRQGQFETVFDSWQLAICRLKGQLFWAPQKWLSQRQLPHLPRIKDSPGLDHRRKGVDPETLCRKCIVRAHLHEHFIGSWEALCCLFSACFNLLKALWSHATTVIYMQLRHSVFTWMGHFRQGGHCKASWLWQVDKK